MQKRLTASTALVGGLLAASFMALSSFAQPEDEAVFLGTYEMEGRYSNLRKTKADIAIVKSDGVLTVDRTGRYTSRRHRRKPAFRWVSKEVRLEDGKLKATFRITKEGKSLTLANSSLTDALNGNQPTAADGSTVDPDQVNVFEAVYHVDDEGLLREEITNTTRKKPEHWWRKVATKGKKTSSPDPDVVVQRIKLGHDLAVDNGTYSVVIPIDGKLTLAVPGASITLKNAAGEVAAVSSGDTLVFDTGHEDPALGTYTAEIASLTTSTTLKATFVQLGKIDARIRPWSSHTYYPIYEYGFGTSENTKTLFRTDGPLVKFDKALALSGRQSAIWWERGGDYRTGFGFEHGHYTKKQSPKEKHAEAEWYADLDGDGVIETEDAEGVIKRYDTDADGKVSADEAKTAFRNGAFETFMRQYDDDGDGVIAAGEISASFIGRYDSDSNGDLSRAEFKAALEKDYGHLLDQNSADNIAKFMKKDADGDGFVVAAEVGSPGAVDFQDSSDVDGDFDSFFDRDNIKIVTKAGETHFGNKVTEEGDKLKLFKGRKSDELVVELDKTDVDTRENGIADGDLDDSYSVGWWGHCNAWAMASIIFRKPSGDIEKNGVTFTVRDQKGILVEYGMGDTEDSTFWWQQWGGDDIPPDRYTKGFHEQLHRWLRVEQKGMMADMDMKDPHNKLNFQVWNYPLLGYTATFKEAEGDDPYVLDVVNSLEKGSYSDEDSSSSASVKYRLHLNQDGTIRTGDEAKTDWTQKNSSDKREYIRYLIHPFRFTASAGSRNKNVKLSQIEEIFGDALKYNRLEDLAAEPEAPGLNGAPTTPTNDTNGNPGE